MSSSSHGEGATGASSPGGGSTSFAGGCACGAIRYEGSQAPILSFNCHCLDCQRASGGAFTSVLVLPKAAFKLLKGEPKVYATKADSGYHVQRGFCQECGSPVVITEAHRPDIVLIHAGSLDDPSWHQPIANIYAKRAHAWDPMDPNLPRFPEMPPLPESPLFTIRDASA